jgi:PBSX family phage terminase large subunit
MQFHQAQKQIALDKHRFRVLCCGRRFGKTTLAIEEIKGRASIAESRICYVAPTYQQARDIAWAELRNQLRDVADFNESRLEIKLVNGSIVQLRGWESIETLRGQKFNLVILDEVAMMKSFQLLWEEVIRPTLTDMIGEAVFISTPRGFNHFYDLFNKQDTDKDYKSFHFTSYDNPFLPFDELEKAKQEMSEDRFAQEYMADFRKTQGLVYKEFNRLKHVYTDNPEINVIDTLAGIDWGYTNPASAHRTRKDSDRHYWIDSEYYKTGKTTEEIVEYVKSLKPNKVYPDPAEPDRLDIARKLGLNVREVSKDVEAGIDCVRELLKQGRIHVHSSCLNLIQEFETYMYPEKKPEHNEPELPIKENDHALDEIRYVLFMNEGSVTNGRAHVHYANSSMPLQHNPEIPNAQKKFATTYIPHRL